MDDDRIRELTKAVADLKSFLIGPLTGVPYGIWFTDINNRRSTIFEQMQSWGLTAPIADQNWAELTSEITFSNRPRYLEYAEHYRDVIDNFKTNASLDENSFITYMVSVSAGATAYKVAQAVNVVFRDGHHDLIGDSRIYKDVFDRLKYKDALFQELQKPNWKSRGYQERTAQECQDLYDLVGKELDLNMNASNLYTHLRLRRTDLFSDDKRALESWEPEDFIQNKTIVQQMYSGGITDGLEARYWGRYLRPFAQEKVRVKQVLGSTATEGPLFRYGTVTCLACYKIHGVAPCYS
ncbi:MAG: hypothetical protein Q9220_005180 [cf. Caloplaca sp. 1 TL-2023]